jgi:hypothetical protein
VRNAAPASSVVFCPSVDLISAERGMNAPAEAPRRHLLESVFCADAEDASVTRPAASRAERRTKAITCIEGYLMVMVMD